MANELDNLRPEVREAWRRMRYASELTKGTVMSSTADMELIFRDHLRLAGSLTARQTIDAISRAERAEAELAAAHHERDRMFLDAREWATRFGEMEARAEKAESELAALKARILPGTEKVKIADTDGPDGNPYGWVGGTLLSHNLIGKDVRLVVEE